VETSSLRRKDRSGWRIWLTPLWSTLRELVEISHRPGTYVEHDGRHTYSRTHTGAYTRAPKNTCTHERDTSPRQLGAPLVFSKEMQDVFLTDMAILSQVNGRLGLHVYSFSDTHRMTKKMGFGIYSFVICTVRLYINFFRSHITFK